MGGSGGRPETLAEASEKDVNKLLDRVNNKRSKNKNKEQTTRRCIWSSDSATVDERVAACGAPAALSRDQEDDVVPKNSIDEKQEVRPENNEDEDEIDWETGENDSKNVELWSGDVTIEVENEKKSVKTVRRANAKDKEFAELVHKAHLLCLLARGKLVDMACDDAMLRASIYSLVPDRLVASVTPDKATVSGLVSVVKWLNTVIRVTEEPSCPLLSAGLTQVLSKQAGSEEEVAGITVALFRALGFCTRYVSVLDVVSLKPDAESLEASKNWDTDVEDERRSYLHYGRSLGRVLSSMGATQGRYSPGSYEKSIPKPKVDSIIRSPVPVTKSVSPPNNPGPSETPKSQSSGKKRKGDEEFELELARAMAATGATAAAASASEQLTPPNNQKEPVFKRPRSASKSSDVKPGASMWSRKKGPLLHWAEVFCGDDNSGKWFHVDAARNIVDDPQSIEAASKQPVRYVVAFAGSGAKDVTRRYVTSWSKIASMRVNQEWWDTCLSPLRRLEAKAYSGNSNEFEANDFKRISEQSAQERNAREDMELDVKCFTEPLPTNQQAYKNHHIYVMERWLTRYQTLHPKGPVLGYCGGKPVYPRSCVQELHTKERWLREGFAVKAGEAPVKVLKSRNVTRKQSEIVCEEPEDERSLVLLFGKWQTDPWQPPPAVDGIVPKNERGQVDVWSEKCIPPGAVHLRLPRLVPIVQKLGIDFAPAMVGFEIRQGRSVPVYEGLVVCEEFKDAIMEVYMAEEERRAGELQQRREEQAALRWRQLLRSMVTRERLRAAYEGTGNSEEAAALVNDAVQTEKPSQSGVALVREENLENHVHTYPEEYQSYDEETCIRIKRCACGFELRVEEM